MIEKYIMRINPLLAGGDSMPIGTILPLASDTIPNNWLECDGRALSRESYYSLYEAIGTAYGSGDGSTTFNIPDLRGKSPVGVKTNDTDFNSLGKTGGMKEYTLSSNAGACNSDAGSYGYITEGRTTYQANHAPTYVVHSTYTTGGAWNHSTPVTINNSNSRITTNMQPYQTIYWCIKATNGSGGSIPSGTEVVSTYEESETDVYSCSYVNETLKDRNGSYIYAKPTSSTSGNAGTIQWTNLVTQKSRNITYVSSTTKYGQSYFHFSESGLYSVTVKTHWNNSSGRHFCDLELTNHSLLGYAYRTTDTQNDGAGDPSNTTTFTIAIKAEDDLKIVLYSSTNWTLASASYIQIIKIGELPEGL